MKIDTQEMTNGEEVAMELRGKTGGIPWITIIDPDMNQLVTSDGPGGNIGCPVTDPEIDWFMKMIARTAKNLDDQEQVVLKVALTEHAHTIRNR